MVAQLLFPISKQTRRLILVINYSSCQRFSAEPVRLCLKWTSNLCRKTEERKPRQKNLRTVYKTWKKRANYHSKVKNFIQEEHVPTIDGLAITGPARLAHRPLNCIIFINLYTKLSSESCFNKALKLLYTS